MHLAKWIKWVGMALLIFGFVVVYKVFNPLESGFFPKCPFRVLTGWNCPGCGSQRAIHSLLNGQICAAWGYNPLLVASIPYLLLGFIVDQKRRLHPTLEAVRRFFYGRTAMWTIFAIIVAFWILRNLL